MTKDIPPGPICGNHDRVFPTLNQLHPPEQTPDICPCPGCKETLIWRNLKHRRDYIQSLRLFEEGKEPDVDFHYLILRYQDGLVEVFKGAKLRIQILLAAFQDAIMCKMIRTHAEAVTTTIFIKEISLLLNLSGLHSVQLVDNQEDAKALACSGKGDPYWYPVLKEEKKTEDSSQETEDGTV